MFLKGLCSLNIIVICCPLMLPIGKYSMLILGKRYQKEKEKNVVLSVRPGETVWCLPDAYVVTPYKYLMLIY